MRKTFNITGSCSPERHYMVDIRHLAARGIDEGYLVTFDFSKDKQAVEPQWIEWNGKRIFEVVV